MVVLSACSTNRTCEHSPQWHVAELLPIESEALADLLPLNRLAPQAQVDWELLSGELSFSVSGTISEWRRPFQYDHMWMPAGIPSQETER